MAPSQSTMTSTQSRLCMSLVTAAAAVRAQRTCRLCCAPRS
jgi:hypothetical protein